MIRTSHVGSLPRPEALLALNRRRLDGGSVSDASYADEVQSSIAEVVAHQAKIGIDLPNDGEYAHAMGSAVDYGAWWSYIFPRLAGLGLWTDMANVPAAPPKAGIQLGTFPDRRDRSRFSEAYSDPDAGVASKTESEGGRKGNSMALPVCVEPLSYAGEEEIARDIENLQSGLRAAGSANGFICSIGPGSLARIGNAHYATDEEFVWACADAMREEYLAITNAGLIVQIDEPSFAENWDQFDPAPDVDDYLTFTKVRVEALNHALRDIPKELTRFHLCWGSWHGPHSTDLELKYLVDLLLEVEVGSYSFEAANARHEHEWRVWQDVDLPDDRTLVPGVVGHATNVVEHPELVADRIVNFARLVGAERVIASTDCGLGGRVHPQIAWAKLESLVAGASIASQRV
ncbi:MAG TPA: cobalamin-independent methionine synthase II family protein [Vicinamibacterales bacterium]|nr:cobalamin-independent methionine synthase II family protein [Vicinamibacterales bacterium]